jgi:hypothetical protein
MSCNVVTPWHMRLCRAVPCFSVESADHRRGGVTALIACLSMAGAS